MATASVSWLQLSAGAPAAQALVSWLQLSAAAAPAAQAQVSWLQVSAAAVPSAQAQVSWLQILGASGGGALVCEPAAFAIDVAGSLSLYALMAAAGALDVTGRAATLSRPLRGSALLGQIGASAVSGARHMRPAQLATDSRPPQ